MKLRELRIQNFRSFEDETIDFDDYTCLVGPNGSGKSAVLMALNVFFRENNSTPTNVLELTKEDFHHGNVQEPVRITLTFEEVPPKNSVSENAWNLLELYARHGKLVLFAEAKWDEIKQTAPVKQYGSRLVMAEFAPYFEADKNKALVRDLRLIYADIRKKFPELPAETRGQQMKEALRNYEESLPKERKELKDEPNELYGFTGGLYRLEDIIQWVYVPAVKDASSEQEEGSKTALGQLVERMVRAKIDFKDELAALEEESEAEYDRILQGKKDALKGLGLSLQQSLREWTNPRASLELEWQGDFPKPRRPIARAKVGEDGFIDRGISRMGHGMQRGFLVAILKELVENEEKGGPKLLLGIEEPELYQHPPQAQHMQSVLERLAEPANNSQVIVTSHSPYFVSSKGFKNMRMFRKSGGKKPYSVVKSTNETRVQKRITEAFGEETQSPTSLMATVGQIMQTSQKELFFSPVVVLVEGEEDVAFIATHLNLTGEWKTFRRNGCHFVVAGGKNNMPRLLAIAQEFEIPTFVVCDSDIDKCIEGVEKAERLTEADPKRADRIKSSKAELKKQKEVNKAIASLCDLKIEDPLKCQTIRGGNIVMWKDSIGTEVEASFEEAEWQQAQDEVVKAYGFEQVREKKKNGMVIAATLEELDNKKKQSSALIDLCGRISQYAQRVASGGKI